MAIVQVLKAQSARLGWHLWAYWFHYALAAGVVVGLSQGGLAVVGWAIAVTFLSLPLAVLQVAAERRLFPDTVVAQPQPGDVIRDPRTRQPVINPETEDPYTVPDTSTGHFGEVLLVNPATGALMVGGMGGVDTLGNPFGTDLMSAPTGGDAFDYGDGYNDMGETAVDYSSFDSSGDFDSGSSSGID